MPIHEAARFKEIFRHLKNLRLPIANLENWNVRKDGKSICFLTHAVPIISDAGEYLGYRGVNIDITEKKKARDAATKSENKYRVLLRWRRRQLFTLIHWAI